MDESTQSRWLSRAYCEFESHSIALDRNCGFKVFVTQARVDDNSEVLHQHSAREDDSGYSAEDDIA